MTASELLAHITTNVPVFENCTLLGEGKAFHYTTHLDAINAYGGFKGAPIDNDLDQTQGRVPSDPATHDPGVVFAYLDETETRAEGKNCDILEISFRAAVQATHSQEVTLGAPDTILILNTDITGHRKI